MSEFPDQSQDIEAVRRAWQHARAENTELFFQCERVTKAFAAYVAADIHTRIEDGLGKTLDECLTILAHRIPDEVAKETRRFFAILEENAQAQARGQGPT